MKARAVSRKERQAKTEKVITAIVWYFGCSRKKALEYMGENSRQTIDAIVDGFETNAKSVFYND